MTLRHAAIWVVEDARKIATMLRMLGVGDTTRGFQQFLQTDAGRTAPPWVLEQLAALPWPAGIKPTAETFTGLAAVLMTAAADPVAASAAPPVG